MAETRGLPCFQDKIRAELDWTRRGTMAVRGLKKMVFLKLRVSQKNGDFFAHTTFREIIYVE